MPETQVARLLADLVARLPDIVPTVGLYAAGSFGTPDFEPERSDVDLVAVLEKAPDEEELKALTSVHRALARQQPVGPRLHCLYAARPDLENTHREWPYWADGKMRTKTLTAITRIELHDHGVVVAGEPIAGRIPYVTPEELVDAVRTELGRVWLPASRRRLRWYDDTWVDLGLTSLARARAAITDGELLSKSGAIARLGEFGVPEWLRQDVLARRRGWAREHGLRFRIRRARVVREVMRTGVERLLSLSAPGPAPGPTSEQAPGEAPSEG
jgi:hypothetical protein